MVESKVEEQSIITVPQGSELCLGTAQGLSYHSDEVECIRTGRNNEGCVFDGCYENHFGNWCKECIIDRDFLGTRTLCKCFSLSMCTG